MKSKLPSAEEIWRLYDQEKLSAQEIADRFGCAQTGVIRKLNGAGYKLRSRPEALRLAYQTGRHKITITKGPEHWAWKGGKDRREYRKKVQKEECANCGSRQNLGIHHKDLNHYNDDPDNLQVLCVSCHMSLHKKLWWAAKKAGKEPPRSNGPIGWEK